MERCPVCPYQGLRASDLSCPACGVDLTLLRQVQELPSALLNDGIATLEREADDARGYFAAAAVWPRVRGRALLLLGAAEADSGDLRAAERRWREAARFGESERALVLLRRLREPEAARLTCPNRDCQDAAHGRRGNIALVRVYGSEARPLWRCRSCGTTFSGTRQTLLFRARLPNRKAYRIVAELLRGTPEHEVASESGVSRSTVRRLAARTVSLGPAVAEEVATAVGAPTGPLRRGWRRLAARAEKPGTRRRDDV